MPRADAVDAVQRVALVLHGRIGLWRTRSSHIDDPKVVWLANAPQLWRQAPKSMDAIDISPHSTLAGFAAFGRGSLWQHVVEPNRAAGIQVHCFLHSWHKEIGKQLDAMYEPILSQHDEVRRRLNNVQSQHLSMKIALDLAVRHEAARLKPKGKRYDLMMIWCERDTPAFSRTTAHTRHTHYISARSCAAKPRMHTPLHTHTCILSVRSRYDILFFRTLHFAPLAGGPLWLPHWCHRYPLTAESGMLIRSACGNWPGHGEGYLVHPATATGVYPPLKNKLPREADFDYAYLDWWFVATPAVARTFGQIHDEYEGYKAALEQIGPFPMWSHFFWGHHINKRLRLRQQVPM